MYLMQPSNEELKWDENHWLILYDAWQPDDFNLLRKYGLDPKDYVLSNTYRKYQRVVRRSDGQVFHLYF